MAQFITNNGKILTVGGKALTLDKDILDFGKLLSNGDVQVTDITFEDDKTTIVSTPIWSEIVDLIESDTFYLAINYHLWKKAKDKNRGKANRKYVYRKTYLGYGCSDLLSKAKKLLVKIDTTDIAKENGIYFIKKTFDTKIFEKNLILDNGTKEIQNEVYITKDFSYIYEEYKRVLALEQDAGSIPSQLSKLCDGFYLISNKKAFLKNIGAKYFLDVKNFKTNNIKTMDKTLYSKPLCMSFFKTTAKEICTTDDTIDYFVGYNSTYAIKYITQEPKKVFNKFSFVVLRDTMENLELEETDAEHIYKKRFTTSDKTLRIRYNLCAVKSVNLPLDAEIEVFSTYIVY